MAQIADVKSDFHTIIGKESDEFEIYGKLLSERSSYQPFHTHPERDDDGNSVFAEQRSRCSRCRWFEVRIYRVERYFYGPCTCGVGDGTDGDEEDHKEACGEQPPPGKFLVVTYGMTIVPGEIIKRHPGWAVGARTVFQLLVQNGPRGQFLPSISALALSDAAECDVDIQRVWDSKPLIGSVS